MKIAVGISGGVDSAVAAYLLQQDGHEVIGTIMKIWDQGCVPTLKGNACYGPDEEEDINDAQQVCDFLNIPLHIINCAEQYKEIVLTYFKNEYHTGRTPNPCVCCNQNIKFGVLPSLLAESGIPFDRFATGHYAKTFYDADSRRYLLEKADDKKKDQTYFLFRLSQEQLSKCMFPLGSYTKNAIRSIAQTVGLPVHDKAESQDFYSGDYADLLGGNNNPRGNIVDTTGTILGQHNGIWNYTIGQRKGIGVFRKEPLYVLGINAEKNEVIVGDKSSLQTRGLYASNINYIAAHFPRHATVKIRSNACEIPCSIEKTENRITVLFDEPQSAVTPGQSAVIYAENSVICGGTIDEAIPC